MLPVTELTPRRVRPLIAALTTIAMIGCGGGSSDAPGQLGANQQPSSTSGPAPSTVITVNPSVKYQTMTGWEATAEGGQNDIASYPAYRAQLLDLAVNTLGINRLRVEVRSGAENPVDTWAEEQSGALSAADWRCQRYATINDNADPMVINPAGFHFSELDATMNRLVLPMKALVEARGEHLYLNVEYVAFARQCSNTPYAHLNNPPEYAEFVLATYQHLQSTFNITPDSWEVILEPDNTGGLWDGSMIGRAIVAAGDRLKAAGFTPHFVAPSTMSMTSAASYIDAMMAVPGVQQYLKELSYHRYAGVSNDALAAIVTRANQYGLQTSMLEHIGSDYQDLYTDLTAGQNSAWQQYTLGYPGSDGGGAYFIVGSGNSPTVTMGSRTTYLMEYFRYVRAGAVRVGTSGGTDAAAPVAFINTNGGFVVVTKTTGAVTFRINGLPAGTYGVSYTTATASGSQLPNVTATAGNGVDVTMPAAGVITVYRQS
ncbi:MAG TPA: carboxypeptidase-like regulatory domain-containing protein [Gemmatimonadaceae bacterium]|nr:carboxypeptidase-like regulatory domain-containing protein [Gemmatimonadaceae bacterium]